MLDSQATKVYVILRISGESKVDCVMLNVDICEIRAIPDKIDIGLSFANVGMICIKDKE